MALSDTFADILGYAGLGADINKGPKKGDSVNEQGAIGPKLPELELDMKDEEIIKLTEVWQKTWEQSPKYSEWKKMGEDNQKYWLGKQFDVPRADTLRPMVDNVIFEALETYLPQATRRNPDPVVWMDDGQQTQDEYTTHLKNRLGDLGDKNKLRLKLKDVTRHWAIYLLGVGKFGWDLDKDIPIMRVIRPWKLILDPEAPITSDGYTGTRIGEHRKMEASKLKSIIGDGEGTSEAKRKIDEVTKDKDGTEVGFIEWWTPEYFCWTLEKTVLLKRKNPNWNWEGIEMPPAVDDYGQEVPGQPTEAINHFKSPKMPYAFLTVFSLGDRPMDSTSLITQNLAQQDVINKRNRQIDKNVDSLNGGMVVSLARSGLTEGQAKSVTSALRKGGTVIIPDGAPNDAVQRYPTGSMAAEVFNNLVDMRNRTRDIFGTAGSSAAGLSQETTVRGKILNRAVDTDRIGGGVSEYLEQFADEAYNWFVQLLYVYDEEIQGLAAQGQTPPPVVISVKEGSLLPKDSTTIANQAIELASGGKMSTLDLYKRLEYPNPEELAANAWLEQNAPQLLFKGNPLVEEAMGMQQQAAMAQQEQEMQVAQAKNPDTAMPQAPAQADPLSEVPMA